MAEITGHHHIALSVSDCEASAAWYARMLGFVELFREEAPGRRARVMRFPSGGYSVGLVEHQVDERDSFDPRRTGLDHLAFTVGQRADLDTWADRLDAAGVTHSGVIDIQVGAILNFADPDGIAIALFWESAEPTLE